MNFKGLMEMISSRKGLLFSVLIIDHNYDLKG